MMFCGSQQQSSLHTSYAWCNTAPGDLDLCGGALGLNGVEPRTRCNAHFEVTRLDLGGLELSGVRLPTELGQLTALHTLDVSNNQLLGGLPTQLGYLEVLTDLRLSNAGIEGSIPTQLGFMYELKEFQLAGNSLSGTVPFYSSGRELRVLSLSDQSGPGISGTLPLAYLDVPGRSARGQYYASQAPSRRLGELRDAPYEARTGYAGSGGYFEHLERIELRGARLSGTLPTELGDLRNLQVLDLQDIRELGGAIPTELGRLKTLRYLYLGGTRVGGAPTLVPLQLDAPRMPSKQVFCFPLRLDAEPFRVQNAYNPLPAFDPWEQQCF